MTNPSRTQQNPIFEPLFSQKEELHTPPTHLIHSPSSEWLISTHSASLDRAFPNNQLRRAPTTIFNQELGTHEASITHKAGSELASGQRGRKKLEPIACYHGKPSASVSPNIRDTSLQTAPPSRSLSSGNVDKHVDDGSVASKLLASLTKSMSSPSLLSSCKESVRETPYQKALRLRMMNLQHCAEELGSESSDGALIYNDVGNNSSFDSFSLKSSLSRSSESSPRSSFAWSPPSEIPQKDQVIECDSSPMMVSVRSAPNLRCPSLVSRHNTHIKERSFPPPLTHTLPRSASSDSFAFSLRAHREDGRFMLKEVKVPCHQYLHASRKDGRLTLQLFTSDEGGEQEDSAEKGPEDVRNLQQGENVVDVCEGALTASSDKNEAVGNQTSHEIGILSVKTVDVGGDLERGAKKFDEFEGNTSRVTSASEMRKKEGLSAKHLLIASGTADDRRMKDDVSHLSALCMKTNGVERNFENWPTSSGLNLPYLSNPTHAPVNSPRLKLISPLIRLAQCRDNMVLQSKSIRNNSDTRRSKSMLGLEISSASLKAAGFATERSMSSTILFKDVGASSLMENVTKLVNSFGLEEGKVEYSRELERSGFKDCQHKNSSAYVNGIQSINIGVKKVDKSGRTHSTDGVHILNVECDSRARCIDVLKGEGSWIDMNGSGGLTTASTTLRLDVQLPLHLDWVHNLHCKELVGRNNFVIKGFPCVAIRS